MDTIVAYIGLDWADERHSVHLQTAEGAIEHFELEQKPAVLHEWVAQLQQRFAGGKIAVALEQRKGAVIHALLMYDCFALYPINPKALADLGRGRNMRGEHFDGDRAIEPGIARAIHLTL